MNVIDNRSLKNLNTFGIDVNTRLYTEIFSEDELKEVLRNYRKERMLILGGGSNILFTGNYEGIVIKNSIPGIDVLIEDEDKAIVKAGAGVVWNDLVQFCIKRNFGGIENLILIPGTAGAAPIQNIGAYGVELKDVFHSLKGIYVDDLSEGVFAKEECHFGYRNSIFKNELKGKFVITYVLLELSKKPVLVNNYGAVNDRLRSLKIDHPGIADIADVIAQIRREKLPDPAVLGNAGSFFKNPVISEKSFTKLKEKFPAIPSYSSGEGHYKIPAGYLIEQTGWKGKRSGHVGSHEMQSLVLVNYGGASGEEVLNLAARIKSSVKEIFDIDLHEEVNII